MHKQVKVRGLPVSELLQAAVQAELRRLDFLAETDRYLTGLIAEVGAPIAAQRARRCRGSVPRAQPRSQGGATSVLVLDSGGVSRLAERTRQAAALTLALRDKGLHPMTRTDKFSCDSGRHSWLQITPPRNDS